MRYELHSVELTPKGKEISTLLQKFPSKELDEANKEADKLRSEDPSKEYWVKLVRE